MAIPLVQTLSTPADAQLLKQIALRAPTSMCGLRISPYLPLSLAVNPPFLKRGRGRLTKQGTRRLSVADCH